MHIAGVAGSQLLITAECLAYKRKGKTVVTIKSSCNCLNSGK